MEAYRSKFARRYDREFKENAVALVQSGRTISEVARDLDVSHWSLNRWVKDPDCPSQQCVCLKSHDYAKTHRNPLRGHQSLTKIESRRHGSTR
jgi:Transposase